MDKKAMDEEIKTFVKERDAALLSLDVDRVIALHVKHNPGLPTPSREVMELSMHKAITAARSLPREFRMSSKKWLQERGSTSMDYGDLSDA